MALYTVYATVKGKNRLNLTVGGEEIFFLPSSFSFAKFTL